eukprot:jgi/Bigna1/130061/aug1.10_g4769
MKPSTRHAGLYQVVGPSGATVRKHADLSSKVKGRLPIGENVTVIETIGRRAHVTYPMEGWVSVCTSGDFALILEQLAGFTSKELEELRILQEKRKAKAPLKNAAFHDAERALRRQKENELEQQRRVFEGKPLQAEEDEDAEDNHRDRERVRTFMEAERLTNCQPEIDINGETILGGDVNDMTETTRGKDFFDEDHRSSDYAAWKEDTRTRQSTRKDKIKAPVSSKSTVAADSPPPFSILSARASLLIDTFGSLFPGLMEDLSQLEEIREGVPKQEMRKIMDEYNDKLATVDALLEVLCTEDKAKEQMTVFQTYIKRYSIFDYFKRRIERQGHVVMISLKEIGQKLENTESLKQIRRLAS